MEGYRDAFIIIGACGMVLLILAVKRNSQLIMNLLHRGLSGTVLIFVLNYIMMAAGYPAVCVGLNPLTLLTSTILGFPGLILLFGIKIYGLL